MEELHGLGAFAEQRKTMAAMICANGGEASEAMWEAQLVV